MGPFACCQAAIRRVLRQLASKVWFPRTALGMVGLDEPPSPDDRQSPPGIVQLAGDLDPSSGLGATPTTTLPPLSDRPVASGHPAKSLMVLVRLPSGSLQPANSRGERTSTQPVVQRAVPDPPPKG